MYVRGDLETGFILQIRDGAHKNGTKPAHGGLGTGFVLKIRDGAHKNGTKHVPVRGDLETGFVLKIRDDARVVSHLREFVIWRS
jgi:hypothetical protein